MCEVVDAEVGELPAGVVVEPAEAVEACGSCCTSASGAGPSQASQSKPSGGLLVGRVADALGPLVLDVERAHRRSPCRSPPARTSSAASWQIGLTIAAGCRTCDDALVLAGRLDHRAALGDAQRQRLLDSRRPCPPGRRGSSAARASGRGWRSTTASRSLLVEQLAVVLVLLRVAADLLGGEVEVRLVDVADGRRPRQSLCARNASSTWSPRLPRPMNPRRTRLAGEVVVIAFFVVDLD